MYKHKRDAQEIHLAAPICFRKYCVMGKNTGAWDFRTASYFSICSCSSGDVTFLLCAHLQAFRGDHIK